MNPAELEALAVDLARRAGHRAVKMRQEAVAGADTKSSPTDPVTEADRAAEALIVDGLAEARPEDGIIGEEGTSITGRSGIDWHIDPIDGTTNFVYGIPAWAVSIGVAVDGVLVAGVVFNPVTDELFRASTGGGAWLNDEPLSPTSPAALATSLVATGFSYHSDRRSTQAALAQHVIPQVRDIRRFGSAALDLCAVAAGRLDAYYEHGLNTWDVAAGLLIAREAGAVDHTFDQGWEPAIAHSPDWLADWLVVSAATISDDLVEMLRSASQGG